jgi:hypothetical protein
MRSVWSHRPRAHPPVRACLTPPATHWPQQLLPDSLSHPHSSHRRLCVRARRVRVCAPSGPPSLFTVVIPDDVIVHIASFFDGKTARKCAPVCRLLAELATTHEDLRAPVAKAVSEVDGYMQKYVAKGAAIQLSPSQLELHKELFGDSDSEDDE